MKKTALLFIFFSSLLYSQTDGTLDTSFGTNGKVFTDLSSSSTDFAEDGIQLSDGKILVGGYATANGLDYLLLKYLPTGQLDTSFGTNGISIIELGTSLSRIKRIALQSDGKIIAAGRSGSSIAYATVARINPDGTLDTTFGTGGKTIRIAGTESDIYSLTVLPNNKIIVVGYILNSNSDIQVLKLNEDGSFDTSFGTNGVVVLNFGSLPQRAFCSVMNGDKILIGGVVSTPNEASLLTQLNPDGSLDTSFGTNGYVATPFGVNTSSTYDRFFSVQIFNDTIYAVGYRNSNSFNFHINLAKFTLNGVLDTSFSDDGKLLIDTSSEKDFINDLHVLQDGSILLAGTTAFSSSTNDFFMLKLNADGTYKTDFGTNGIVRTNMNSANSGINKLILNETNIIAIGSNNTSVSSNIALAKYNNANVLSVPKKEQSFNSVLLFPNPTKDKLTLQNLTQNKIDHITISDILGKTVAVQYENLDQIDCEKLSKGLYILHVFCAAKIEDYKIIKQ